MGVRFDSDEFKQFSVGHLLQGYVSVLRELRRRGVTRSENNPVADYAELLALSTLQLAPVPKSTKGYDATDASGKRYEVKGRRLTPQNKSTMLSAIRDLKGGHFDFLVGILFAVDFTVMRAIVIPVEVVVRECKFRSHTNASILELNDSLFQVPGVVDISTKVQAVETVVRSLKEPDDRFRFAGR